MKTAILANDYHCSIASDISVKDAFKAIANVPAWWTTNFEGSARSLHDEFTVRFGETFVNFTISEVVPGEKIVWRVLDCNLHWLKDKKEWKDTKIVWEVSSKDHSTGDHSTRIDMTHVGLVPEVECYSNCESGWNHYIKDSLFKFISGGKGLPGMRKKS
jgi:hypothetical protein